MNRADWDTLLGDNKFIGESFSALVLQDSAIDFAQIKPTPALVEFNATTNTIAFKLESPSNLKCSWNVRTYTEADKGTNSWLSMTACPTGSTKCGTGLLLTKETSTNVNIASGVLAAGKYQIDFKCMNDLYNATNVAYGYITIKEIAAPVVSVTSTPVCDAKDKNNVLCCDTGKSLDPEKTCCLTANQTVEKTIADKKVKVCTSRYLSITMIILAIAALFIFDF